MIKSLKQMNYIEQVAKRAFGLYGVDFYEAINVAETIHLQGNVAEDAAKVHNIIGGEL